MIPPPNAVIMPRVTTPTMSSRAVRTAVSAPVSANANVPARSRASSSVSVLMRGVYRVRRCRPQPARSTGWTATGPTRPLQVNQAEEARETGIGSANWPGLVANTDCKRKALMQSGFHGEVQCGGTSVVDVDGNKNRRQAGRQCGARSPRRTRIPRRRCLGTSCLGSIRRAGGATWPNTARRCWSSMVVSSGSTQCGGWRAGCRRRCGLGAG